MKLTYEDHEIEIKQTEGGIVVYINGNKVYESSRQ